ncbi:hypothetical protein CJA_0930 [Cellvibrio japonicus Ueda107]|uniref:Uncharacterized protein n=1 Tax=Cellvibrio japonicus (strain Ueda107) TaxID=498211 RepID=B3PLA6_CELJU|nr:hypothetical protein CJA_0930 [Cellvibrio japonicus Ueda107]
MSSHGDSPNLLFLKGLWMIRTVIEATEITIK